MPIDTLIAEKRSQKDRILKEVMGKLFARLPARELKAEGIPEFILADGTRCWIRAFVPPRMTDDKSYLQYGFDIRFGDGGSLDHLEFMVRCSGHGGAV